MGNCILLPFSPPKKKTRVLISDGEEEFIASTNVQKIAAGPYQGYSMVHHAQPYLPLPPKTKLKSEEVYYLIPCSRQHCSPPASDKMVKDSSFNGRKVRIVVTRKQLELLVRSAKGFHPRHFEFQSFRARERHQKWQPSLATIQE
ncbi:unnamed protein product [Ilex paraguariensis]|uniref:Uncharacterized protein n=1 Tax=Ilex paraguariensis TaxID=185542 RepID=A0ABC8SIT7_9AQUA